ncbi:MAG: tetratricopeptide repeat protein [Candidatus Poribacteria bacterium]|nr:tetratricopeptide repeat protein [Candidatus Poribacteria bacterium]
MAKKESRRVKTLRSFMEWAEQFEPGLYLFRGVSNAEYKIQASAYRRLIDERDQTPANLLEINKRMIDDARLQGHGQKNGDRLFDLELLAELQHYGAATCLIDFTYSAQVALWMACGQDSKDAAAGKVFNGKVFAVDISDPNRFQKVTSQSVEKDIDCFFTSDKRKGYSLYQWQPKQQNNRIIAQQSVFLFGGAQIESEAECTILKNSKESILTSLEKSGGISEARMFPDFDGFARLRAHNRPYIEHDALGYLQRGIEAHKERKLDEAIKHYTKSIQLEPDNFILGRAYNNRGNAYDGKRKQDLAFEDYSMAIKINPDDPDAYLYRGFIYESKRYYEKAVKDYDKAIELEPDRVDAYIYRAGVANRDSKLVIKDYNKAIELNPHHSFAHINRAQIYRVEGEIDLAIKDYSTVIEVNPNYTLAYVGRAETYMEKNEINLAIADYSRVIELMPDDAQGNYYFLCGIARLHVKDWEGAKEDFIASENGGSDIIALFSEKYRSITDFEKEFGVTLPKDISVMLTREKNNQN